MRQCPLLCIPLHFSFRSIFSFFAPNFPLSINQTKATASRACCDLLCCEKGMLAEYEHSGSFSNGSFNESVNGPINSHGAPHTTSNGYANVSGYENGYSNGHGNYDGFSSGNLGNNDNCVLVPWAVRQWTFAHVVNQSAFFWTVQLSIAVHVLLLIAAPWPYTPAAEGLQNTVLAIALAELVSRCLLYEHSYQCTFSLSLSLFFFFFSPLPRPTCHS